LSRAICSFSLGRRRYDLITDDGPHSMASQSLPCVTISLVRKGGVLVIEDVQSLEIASAMIARSPGSEILDLRYVKGRYDDILIVRAMREAGPAGRPTLTPRCSGSV